MQPKRQPQRQPQRQTRWQPQRQTKRQTKWQQKRQQKRQPTRQPDRLLKTFQGDSEKTKAFQDMFKNIITFQYFSRYFTNFSRFSGLLRLKKCFKAFQDFLNIMISHTAMHKCCACSVKTPKMGLIRAIKAPRSPNLRGHPRPNLRPWQSPLMPSRPSCRPHPRPGTWMIIVLP